MRQIIAMGGGGFSMEKENPLLDLYILAQSQKEKPRVCFVPTASGDAEGYIQKFYRCFEKFECETAHLSVFKAPIDLEGFIAEQDIFYVGGGNTRNLLLLWKDWKIDELLRRAYQKGAILTGLSAGSICWFEQGVTDSFPGKLSSLECLGLLKGSNCPHYDGEKERRPSYHKLIENGEMTDGYAADDGVALHYINESLHRVVSSRENAKAYSVKKEEGSVVESEVRPIYLKESALI
ncbi:Peptidase E [Seinonella peptonophila]|uniref:Peptidase E n=1 Tax=Seinonella peptonophila TaxID=112248 RepID=A0A1M4ZWZ6_9BACL|nr:peptidase E [Seinonella peptonophila]SHF22569.1 Peptidase E [Seinonella peptonophila]